jgi:hypothetical protein
MTGRGGKAAYGRATPAPAAAERPRDKAPAPKKGGAFGGPAKAHKPKQPPGLASNVQPKEDRRPNSMSTIERKRGVEGLGLKLPKISAQKAGEGRDRSRSDHDSGNNKPFSDKGQGGGMMGLLAKKGGGPIKVAYEADEGNERGRGRGHRAENDSGNGRWAHSPVRDSSGPRSGGSAELRGESEYMACGEGEAIGGAQLDRLLQQARSARAAPTAQPGKAPPGGKAKKATARR